MFVTGHGTSSAKYRPEFLDHFDQKEKEKASEQSNDAPDAPENPTGQIEQSQPDVNSPAAQALQKQLQQIAGGQPVLQNVAVASASNNTNNPSKFQQCIAEGDLEFVSVTCNASYDETISCLFPNAVFFLQQLKYLSYNELTDKMSNLDQEMEREIDDLRRRYHAKRQPILDAMDQKRKRQQNF